MRPGNSELRMNAIHASCGIFHQISLSRLRYRIKRVRTSLPSGARIERSALTKGVIAIPVLAAFGLFTLPVRAMPAASVQLFRVDGHGVKPMPAISTLLAAQAAKSAVVPGPTPLLAQAGEAGTATNAPAPLTSLSQTFVSPLPTGLSGTIRLVEVAEDGTLGAVVEEIPFSSSRVSISSDRLVLSVVPSNPIQPGQSVMLQLPSRSPEGVAYVYPYHLASTPCLFKVPATTAAAGAAAVAPAALAPAAAVGAAAIPTWAIVVGAVVVGVGVAAAAGAFSSTGGGGGTSASSQ